MLNTALSYIRNGYNVIPLRPNGKTPIISSWVEYQGIRVTEADVRKWWGRWPKANIAVITGAASGGLAVIDVDGDDNPWPQEPDQKYDLSKAAIVKTGGGGRHYWFRTTGALRNTAGKIANKVDFRGDGGYVVAPPSIHESGRPYQWVEGCELSDELAPLPEWVAGLLIAPESKEKTGEELIDMLDGVGEGQRNDTAARLAGRYLGLGMSGDEVTKLLIAWNQSNIPPMTADEISKTVVSIARRELLKHVEIPTGNLNDEQRWGALKKISEKFEIDLQDIVFVNGENPYYEFTIGDRKAKLPTGSLQYYHRWAAALESAKVLPRPLPKKESFYEWAQLMHRVMREVEIDADATIRGEIEDWIDAYFEAHPPVENGSLIVFNEPTIHDESTWFHKPSLERFIKMWFGTVTESKKLSQEFAKMGYTRKVVRQKLENNDTKNVKMYCSHNRCNRS